MKRHLYERAYFRRSMRMIYTSPEDFDRIFTAHYSWLVGLAWRVCRRKEVAEDIVQDVFVRTWDNRKRITLESDVKSYLATAVIRQAITRKERESRIVNVDTVEQEHAESSHALDDRDQRLSMVRRAVGTLPERCRVIFVLKRDEGLTIQEIAQYLDISPKTVENQLLKAMKLIRAFVKNISSE